MVEEELKAKNELQKSLEKSQRTPKRKQPPPTAAPSPSSPMMSNPSPWNVRNPSPWDVPNPSPWDIPSPSPPNPIATLLDHYRDPLQPFSAHEMDTWLRLRGPLFLRS